MRFDTLFYLSENVHLKKDVGQIPFMFHKLLGYDSSLVTYCNTSNEVSKYDNDPLVHYPYIKEEVKGLKLRFLAQEPRGKFFEKAVVRYIFKNARKIDILHLFHFSIETIVYSLLYKLLNPKGILYVKLDIDVNYYRSREHFINTNTRFSFVKIKFFNLVVLPWFKNVVDLFSAETQAGLELFKTRFKISDKRIIKLKNGVDSDMLTNSVGKLNDYDEKENIIVSVGTLGVKHKNYSFLFDALNNVDLKDWKIYCVGKIEESFIREIETFFDKNPEKKAQIILTGQISDNKALYEIYNRSKIICQVSTGEGFSISTCEALYFGNYPILSDSIGSIEELTNNYQFGQTVELNNKLHLTSALQQLINNPEKIRNDFDAIIKYSRRSLVWQEIIPQLKEKLVK